MACSKRSPKTTLVVIWVLVWFGLAGCAGLGKKLDPPKISMVNLVVEKTTLFETTFKVDLRIMNANDVNLTLKGIDCEMLLFKKRFATGISNTVTEVPAYGSAIVPIHVYSSLVDMMKIIANMNDSERLEYEIKGSVRIGGDALLPPVIPFASKGELGIENFPMK